MTGLECLKHELRAKGFTQAQADSKVAIGVLEILSNSHGEYINQDSILKDTETLEKRIAQLKEEHEEIVGTIKELRNEKDKIIADINDYARSLYDEKCRYIESFFEAIESCETQEGRDTLRMAQMYVNSVDVDTKYDNTAFIIGLSAILSGGRIAPIEELKKINKKIPQIKIEARDGFRYAGHNNYMKFGQRYKITMTQDDDPII